MTEQQIADWINQNVPHDVLVWIVQHWAVAQPALILAAAAWLLIEFAVVAFVWRWLTA